MKRNITCDPFFDRQPPLSFLEEFKSPLHSQPIPEWNIREAEKNEVSCMSCFLNRKFPDEEMLLDTIYDDFFLFCKINGISGNEYEIRTEYRKMDCFEDYIIEVSEYCCVISAGDTEGIRRGLVYIEDEMQRRNGAFLPKGKISRHAYIKSRITRCFFSPINRAPKFQDELYDDIDYYPDEYLNRLAHEGMNGVWIYTKFPDLVPSNIIPEYGRDSERRISKLRRITEKCRRYGIKPYVFAIEPVALATPEMTNKYPELRGHDLGDGKYNFCTNTEKGKAYCKEAMYTLCNLCPGIGGIIIITMGERGTACGSGRMDINCSNCKDKPIGEVLSQTVDSLMEGVRKSVSNCEFISWSYGHRFWSNDAIKDYVRSAPDDVMLMQNFEEMGFAKQLGRERIAIDYWLSYVGPSQMFEATARQANESNKHLYAKTQVCCSHELATVPYVPVPGILWEKYKAMRSYNVEGVMQCWYFGNYPSLMNKTAGELAFLRNYDDKNAFLRHIAGIYWGENNVDKVVDAWNLFEKSYRNYPLNIMFSYYGPVHDGPVWELQLLPKNFPLPRSWQSIDPVNGDRIGESLLSGHTLEEAIELCDRMLKSWYDGCSLLPLSSGYYLRDEQLSVVEAIRIQFRSALNILLFYKARDELGRNLSDNVALLSYMRKLVEDEISNSHALCFLCKKDGRLGYHSEGEGYKYFPDKLLHRVEYLKTMLKTEFPMVEKRIEDTLPPLEYYLGIEEDSVSYALYHGSIEDASWADFDKAGSRFRACVDRKRL
ncbi:MAG: hypothetical protein GX633_02440, partial [Clostridiales bacterium]|nr:hypothetical protein [Clostridiales bacterium]